MIVRLVLIGFFLYAIYLATKNSKSQKRVSTAEAGPFDGASSNPTDLVYSTLDNVKDEKGNILFLNHYIPYQVENNCMEFVGIKSKDIVFIKQITPAFENVNDIIKQFDIVLITIGDKNKIRMVDKINDDNTLVTFYFVKDEVNEQWFRRYSTQPHKLENVCGIVSHKNCNTGFSKEVA